MTRHMKIRTKGLKEHDQDVELEPRTLVSAPNEAGKSTLAEAIRFGALGFVPVLGKRHADTAKLMCGGQIAVTIELADGKTFTRELHRAPKGSFGGSVECSWLKNAKASEHHQEILKLFGEDEADAAEVLDVRQLLDATPNKRAERIEALLSAGQKTPEDIAHRIAELTTRRLAGKEDDKLDNWRDLLPILTEHQRVILNDESGMLEGKVQEGGIPAALKWANAEKRDASKDSKKKAQAKAEIERRREELPDVSPEDLQRLREEHDALREKIGAAQQRVTDAEGVIRKIEVVGDQVHDLANKVMNAQAQVEQVAEIKARIEKNRKGLAEAQKKLDELDAPPSPDFRRVEQLDATATAREAEAAKVDVPELVKPTKESVALLHAKDVLNEGRGLAVEGRLRSGCRD